MRRHHLRPSLCIPSSILLVALCGALSVVACSPSAEAPSPSASSVGVSGGDAEVVAILGGEEITLQALDDFAMRQLFERETKSGKPATLYQVRMTALKELVSRTAVQQAAKRQGLTLDAFVSKTRDEQPPVAEEVIVAFFAENRSKLGEEPKLEQLRPAIRTKLQQDALNEAMGEIVAGTAVEIFLNPPRVEVETTGVSRGPDDAPVTIVEFSDYQCPFCRRAEAIVAEVLEKYPNEVRFVYRHYPLAQHPVAREASEAAVCAEAQGQFWEFHALVFEHQASLSPALLRQFVGDLRLDRPAFEQCMQDPETGRRVAADVAEAERLGADSTPVFLINGLYFVGAQPVEHFDRLIRGELEAAGRS